MLEHNRECVGRDPHLVKRNMEGFFGGNGAVQSEIMHCVHSHLLPCRKNVLSFLSLFKGIPFLL